MEHPTDVTCIFLEYYILALITRLWTVHIKELQVIRGIFYGVPFKNSCITRIYYIPRSGSGSKCFRFTALLPPVESPLSYVLAVAPETSAVTLPAGTAPVGC